MTANKKSSMESFRGIGRAVAQIAENGSGFELRRIRGRAVLFFEGVLSIRHFSEELICLATHGGRITVKGREFALLLFEARAVKIYGIVESVELGYGRS